MKDIKIFLEKKKKRVGKMDFKVEGSWNTKKLVGPQKEKKRQYYCEEISLSGITRIIYFSLLCVIGKFFEFFFNSRMIFFFFPVLKNGTRKYVLFPIFFKFEFPPSSNAVTSPKIIVLKLWTFFQIPQTITNFSVNKYY